MDLEVAGSSPVGHPIFTCSSLLESRYNSSASMEQSQTSSAMNEPAPQRAMGITLRRAVIYYCAAIGVWVASIQVGGFLMGKTHVFGYFFWIPVFTYLAAGVFLNRRVLRRLIEWHPVYNTLQNVTNAKITSVFFWLMTYPILLYAS